MSKTWNFHPSQDGTEITFPISVNGKAYILKDNKIYEDTVVNISVDISPLPKSKGVGARCKVCVLLKYWGPVNYTDCYPTPEALIDSIPTITI